MSNSAESFSITGLLSAGEIKEDDGMLGMIQGLTVDQANGVALWLALATKGPVWMRYLSLDGPQELRLSYEEAVKHIGVQPGGGVTTDYPLPKSSHLPPTKP